MLKWKGDRFQTLNSTLPNGVCIREAGYNVMKNRECELKLIIGAFVQGEKYLLALLFTNGKWSANLPKIRGYDSNRVKPNLWLHIPCKRRCILYQTRLMRVNKHDIAIKALRTNHLDHSLGHQAASPSTFLNSHLPKTRHMLKQSDSITVLLF